MPDHKPRKVMSLAAFARHLGRSPQWVSQLRAAGRLVLTPDGKVRVAESEARIAATADPAHQAVAERHAMARGAAQAPTVVSPGNADGADEAVAAISPSYADARARREHAEAQLRELDLSKRRGEILERSDVIAAAERAIVAAGARLDALADMLAPQLVVVDDEGKARALIAEAVAIIRRELARDFAAMAEVVP